MRFSQASSVFRRTFLFGAVGVAICDVGCSNSLTDPPEEGKARIVFDQLNAAILSVSGTAADDIYAVGADPGDGLGPYVLHYNGQNWRRLESGASGALWWISVEMIGGSFYMAGTQGKVLRFTPADAEFEQFLLPGEPTLFGVWGSSPDDLWAVGGDPDDEDMGGGVWRFDGTAWAAQDLSEAAPAGLPMLYKVWGRDSNDVYIVGRSGAALHFDGEGWSRVICDTDRTLFTVHGNATQVVASGGVGDAVIAELEEGKFVNHATAGTFQMNGVFIPPAGGGVTVGSKASVAFRTQSGWELQDTGLESPRDLHAVWMDPDGGIWAVGGTLSAALGNGIIIYIGEALVASDVIPN